MCFLYAGGKGNQLHQAGGTYSVSEKILKALHMKYASISWSMSNPFMIVFDKAWKGLDPETKNWPARRTTSLSLNVTF